MPRTRLERRVLIAAVILAVVVLVVGATAVYAGGTVSTPVPTAPPVASKPTTSSVPGTGSVFASAAPAASLLASNVPGATGSYALDFTLPTFGKSGCLVCHGDPSLVVSRGDANISFWIDEEAYARSAHAKIICTGCHLDYGYKAPHGQGPQDWRSVAKQACKNCHKQQFDDWSLGGHAPKPGVDQKPDPKGASKPLCGDCHGSHNMPVLKNNPAGKAQVQKQAQLMCGRTGCHADYWANYNDYYHGVAYKRGAEDAPACWQCHGTHTMLKSTDRFSPTNKDNFKEPNSCGGCHRDATASYSSYSPLIHGRAKIQQANPLYGIVSKIIGR
ncbi:MAG: hypothetical protein Q7W30_08540 [Coriobacteriia bacterium]|nr:hypothetical protein [Coriobacteriia bacterium]